MQINLSYDSTLANVDPRFTQAINYAAAQIGLLIADPIAVTVSVDLTALPPGSQGQATPAATYSVPYASLQARLGGPVADPTGGRGLTLQSAQAEALLITSATNANAGTMRFNAGIVYNYMDDRAGSGSGGDLVAEAERQLTQLIGRDSYPGQFGIYDLSRWTGYQTPGVPGVYDGAHPAYLSFDQGATSWGTSTALDPAGFQNPDLFGSGGEHLEQDMSQADVKAMQAAGFQINPDAIAFSVDDMTTNQASVRSGDAYTGPVAGLDRQFIAVTPDTLNISANEDNVFIHGGSGNDGMLALGGNNVLDGGTGSNFLTGAVGPGTDTYFVDDRGPSSAIWSTVNGFKPGDSATIWGMTPNDFTLTYADGQGADGYRGMTVHATKAAAPEASLTLVGYTTADIGSRLQISYGTVGGNDYMNIHAV